MIPVKIGMTIIITRFTTGPRPMNVWLWCFPFRIILALAFMVLVFITPLYQQEGDFNSHLILFKFNINHIIDLAIWHKNWFLIFDFHTRWFIPSGVLCFDDFHIRSASSSVVWNVCRYNGVLCKNKWSGNYWIVFY